MNAPSENLYPTLTEKTCVSHYNFSSEIKKETHIPETVAIKDGTLREGEQSATSGFTRDQKIEIAKMLDTAGISHLEAGYLGLSKSETDMVATIAKLGLNSKIMALALVYLPEWKDQILQAADIGLDYIEIGASLSPMRLKDMMKMEAQETITRCLNAIELAAKHQVKVLFCATDTTRTDLDTLINLYKSAEDAGAEIAAIADTIGVSSPAGIRFLTRALKQHLNIDIGIHCHNDFGLATANSLAALEGGASMLDATVNGIGERSGNAPLAEIAAILQYMYGYDLGIKMEKMMELSETVALYSGIDIHSTKPLVGRSAFTHTLGAHQWGVRQAWYVYEAIRPDVVGNQRHLPLGRLTHHLLIKDILEEKGYTDLNEESINRITENVRDLSEKEGRFVREEEVIQLADQEV